MREAELVGLLAATVPLYPALAALLLVLLRLLIERPDERWVSRLAQGALFAAFLTSLGLAAWMIARGERAFEAHLGEWFRLGDYAFELSIALDPLALAMMLLTTSITGLIGRFSAVYLHREPGFVRFFALLSFFAAGMLLLVSGGNVDQLFVGWELVGLTSALLIGFFWTRRSPVEAGVRVYVTYRLSDLGLLIGAVLLHAFAGTSSFRHAFAPEAAAALSGPAATITAVCFILAAMGKSAQFPFGGWLPRAMEGPTPSSALFYGALSVHAGVYLLLRAAPLLERSPLASGLLIGVGLTTALHASLVSRVQTDAKSALAYATMAQLGAMLLEIGLGLTTLAAIHLVSHAVLRAWQLLRAPSVLFEAELLRTAGLLVRREPRLVRPLPRPWAHWLYGLALDRFHLDTLDDRLLVAPVLRLGRWVDRLERRWVGVLSGWSKTDSAKESRR